MIPSAVKMEAGIERAAMRATRPGSSSRVTAMTESIEMPNSLRKLPTDLATT